MAAAGNLSSVSLVSCKHSTSTGFSSSHFNTCGRRTLSELTFQVANFIAGILAGSVGACARMAASYRNGRATGYDAGMPAIGCQWNSILYQLSKLLAFSYCYKNPYKQPAITAR